MSLLGSVEQRGRVLLGAIAVYGLAIVGFGLSTHFVLSLVLLALSGAADAVSTVLRQTSRQLLTPDELRGRLTAVTMVFFVGGPQLGEVEAGLVARAFGPVFSVTSGGVLCVLVAAGIALCAPRLRRYSAADDDALRREATARPP